VAGRLLMLWRPGRLLSCGRKVVLLAGRSFFSAGKSSLLANCAHVAKLFWRGVFAGRQIRASAKLFWQGVFNLLQSTTSHIGTNMKIVRKMSTEGIHS